MLSKPKHRLPDLVLVLVTLLWGGTFLVTQVGLGASGPFGFLGTRFAVAALVLSACSLPLLKRMTAHELRAGALIGLCIAVGFACQTVGLMTIDSGKSAFLTALYVPLVPLLELVVFRRRLGLPVWLGGGLAFVGVACMSSPDGVSIAMGRGEWLTVACALVTAIEIILISRLSRGADPRRMAIVQLVVACLLSFGAMGVAGEPFPGLSLPFVACAAGLGLASAFIQVGMNWAQQSVPATRATLIYTLEPVWAGAFGRLAGERMTSLGFVGAGLILGGVLASELPWATWLRRNPPTAPPRRHGYFARSSWSARIIGTRAGTSMVAVSQVRSQSMEK